MPIECAMLEAEPYHLDKCPICASPFEPIMRGQIQRAKVSFLGLFTGKMRPYCALICSQCMTVVGYEDPVNKEWESIYER